MSQGSDSGNDYHQEINERDHDFNCCNKETPVKAYSEVESAQKNKRYQNSNKRRFSCIICW